MTLATSHSPLDRRLSAGFFLIFFLTFTQYDVMVSGKLNYLLFTIPLLMAAVLATQIIALRDLRLPSKAWPFAALYLVFGLWVLPATDMVPLFNYVMLAAVLTIAAMLTMLVTTWPREADIALRAYIWINIVAIMVQVFWNIATGAQLDLHNMLFPFSRHSEIGAQHGFGFVRFNGFHLEPGSYAANVGTATMLCIGLTGRIPMRMTAMVLLTLLITRSASAMVYFSAIAGAIYIRSFRASSTRTMLATPLVLVALAGLVYVSGFDDYIANRFFDMNVQQIAQQDGSARYKLANIDRLLTADFARQVTGAGFMITDCDACGFVNSNGAGFALIFFFGVFGVLLIGALLAVALTRSGEAILLVAMLLLSRHTLVQPAFWIPIILLCVNRQFMSREGRAQ